MPNDDKWAQYVEKSSADKWEQYAQPAEAASSTPSLFEQGQKSFTAKGGNVGMPGSFEGKPENVGEYVPQTAGNIVSGVGNLAEGNVARGAHEILSGGMNALLPAAPFVAAAAPGSFALGTAGSYLGGKVGRGAATIFGRPPDQQDLAEDIGSIAGGALPFARNPAGKLLTTAAGEPRMALKLIAPKRAEVLADYLRPDVKAQAKAAAEQADILAERQKRAAAWDEMNKDFAKRQLALDKERAKAVADAAKAESEARQSVPVSQGPGPYTGPASAKAAKSVMKPPPPSPFAPTATSSAMPIGNAPLPEVPQGTPTPFPTVQPKVKAAAAGAEAPAAPNGESGIPTFGKTLYQMGEEPNLSNPAHVKILKVLQTRSGSDLRALANQGDRFAAFVLRTMPRP